MNDFTLNLKEAVITEKQVKFYQSIPAVALGTALLLMVPLVAMQFTDQVDWSVIDFIIAGALLFGTGTLFVLVMRAPENIIYKCALILTIGATFLMIWANLAVGLIGSGPNPGNLMYIGVLAVLIIGIYRSRFQPAGLSSAMFATAFALALVMAIALLAGMHNYPQSSVIEIVGVNLFFIAPYILSGLLFRYLVHRSHQPTESDA